MSHWVAAWIIRSQVSKLNLSQLLSRGPGRECDSDYLRPYLDRFKIFHRVKTRQQRFVTNPLNAQTIHTKVLIA